MTQLHRRRPHASLVAVLLASVVAAGCSSTNRNVPSNDAEATAPGTTGTDATAASGSTAGATAAPGASAPGAAAAGPRTGAGTADAPASGSTSAGRPGQPNQPGSGSAPASGPTGPGVTATEISIGITLTKIGDFGAALGVNSDFGNSEAQAQAVVDHINTTGGIAGRKVKPVYYVFDLGRPGLTDGQSEQEACAKWTEDNKVFAVVNAALARLALLTCLAKRDVLGVHDQMPIDEKTLSGVRDYYYSTSHVGGMTLDRLARTSTHVFGKGGFFGKDAVVGILHYEDPAYVRVVDEQYRPALAAYGVKKIVTQAAPRFVGAPYESYVARFQSEGVTHVMFLGEAGGYPLLFTQAAENQQYRPKYGLRSDNFPATVLQAAAPAAQLANTTGMGWMPTLDVDKAHDPGPVSASNKLCLEIQRKAGQDMSDRAAEGSALAFCSGLFFLHKTLSSATRVHSRAFADAAAALGTRFVAPSVFATTYGRNRHDGVSAYRDFVFRQGAFAYTSGTKSMAG